MHSLVLSLLSLHLTFITLKLWSELMTGLDPYQGMEPQIYAALAASGFHSLFSFCILPLLPHRPQIVYMADGLRPRLGEDVDERWRELIVACWQNDPAMRPDFAQIVAYLEYYLPPQTEEAMHGLQGEVASRKGQGAPGKREREEEHERGSLPTAEAEAKKRREEGTRRYPTGSAMEEVDEF